MLGRDKTAVTLRDYVDRGLADLARYHDKTVDSIQAEIDRRLGALHREMNFRFAEQATQVTAADAALERRLDAMNEFRESIRDVTDRKVNADLYQQAADAFLARLDRAEAALDRQRGRMSAYAAIGTILALALAVLTLVLSNIKF